MFRCSVPCNFQTNLKIKMTTLTEGELYRTMIKNYALYILYKIVIVLLIFKLIIIKFPLI